MDVTFRDLIKYARMKNVNGSNIRELLKNRDLVYKIEELRESDPNLDEVVEKLQKCSFSKRELDRIKDLYENYFGLEEATTEVEIIAEKFGVSLDKIETLKLDTGEEIYRIIDSNNKDIVLMKNDNNATLEDELSSYSDSVEFEDNATLEDELSSYSDSVEFDSNLETNSEDAAEYQRLHGYNSLDFYTKEEIDKKPELLEGLSINQIEEIRALIKMNNVVFINPKYGLGLGINHQLIYAVYNSVKGTLSVSDSSRENVDTYGEIEELELYDDDRRDVAPEKDYADLVSTTELPVIDEKMIGYYENHTDELDELEEGKQKVYERKINKDDSDKRGFVGYAILIAIVALIGVLFAIIKFIV